MQSSRSRRAASLAPSVVDQHSFLSALLKLASFGLPPFTSKTWTELAIYRRSTRPQIPQRCSAAQNAGLTIANSLAVLAPVKPNANRLGFWSSSWAERPHVYGMNGR
jgi:hypothetical protein